MKAVVQIVDGALVEVDNDTVGSIDAGMMILLGVMEGDSEAEADVLIEKLVKMRTFKEGEKHFEVSVQDIEGGVLVVSQFTLGASFKKGRRPDFNMAEGPQEAEKLYNYFVEKLRSEGVHVETGKFGAYMQVKLTNDGPITYILDTSDL